ncbi:MAG: SseB family protein, partial [bacterium]
PAGQVAPRNRESGSSATHMASVSLVQPDGRRGMLAFTGLDALRRWDPAARPVPVRAPEVARAALEEGADGVLVDIGGPVRFALEGPALRLVAGLAPEGTGLLPCS